MDEIDENLPPVEERLAALRPSRQLLEFYRRKTDELEAEHDKLFGKIENYAKQENFDKILNIFYSLDFRAFYHLIVRK